MSRVFGFLTKRDGLSMPEFKDYYENHHVPRCSAFKPLPSAASCTFCTSE
jgi:hypothetical protein